VPDNTIGVYSYSKYFGGTGWRLGVIALCEDNVLDRLLKELPQADKDELNERYLYCVLGSDQANELIL
jgi:aspartate 4-decarboxylase